MEKRKLRAELENRLYALDEQYLADSDRDIFLTLTRLPKFLEAERVLLYYSTGREVDTKRLIDFCAGKGIPCALPRTCRNGKMDFCLMDGSFELTPKLPFGIPEPPDEAPAIIPDENDVIIVPAFCYDFELYRMGHGAGYFDRYLADCRAYSIGLCREQMMLRRVPREAHDMPTDCLVTEKKVRNR